MPKLSQLRDSIPPMNESQVTRILKKELKTHSLSDYFTWIDLSQPIGSASIAQVHKGIWKATNQPVAIKIQNADSNNLYKLGTYLQKHELKVDLVSAISELRKQITHEFNFQNETQHLQTVGQAVQQQFASWVTIPSVMFHSKRVLVMSFVEEIH